METVQLGTQDSLALGYRFKVSFEYQSSDQNFEMVFQKVSGIGVKRATTDSGNRKDRVGRKQFTNLTLNKGMSLKANKRWNTFLQTLFTKQVAIIKAVVVTLLTDEGQPGRSWKMDNVTLIGWSFSELDASSSNIVMETIELAYEDLKFLKI